jgi:phosphopantetheinyl transferase (holo-ACP synthase)
MARPVWRDVLEQIQLGPEEQAECLALGGPDIERTLRLWGRIAAKEAARRLWLAAGDSPRYPADLAIVEDCGRPRLRDLARPQRNDLPAVSIAHTEGVVVAIAARDPETLVGIGIEPVCEHTEGSVPLALTDGEASRLPSSVKTSRCGWIARFGAAKQAAIKASGLIPAADRAIAEIVAAKVDTGEVFVLLRGDRASEPSALIGATIRVETARRGDHVWAWTLGEKVQQS